MWLVTHTLEELNSFLTFEILQSPVFLYEPLLRIRQLDILEIDQARVLMDGH